MTRDTLITILLVIAGLVLAIVLFGAGALWKGKGTLVSGEGKNGRPVRPGVGQLSVSSQLSALLAARDKRC